MGEPGASIRRLCFRPWAKAARRTCSTSFDSVPLQRKMRDGIPLLGTVRSCESALNAPPLGRISVQFQLPGQTKQQFRALPTCQRSTCDKSQVLLLADAQTSGGLLFGASPERARAAVDELAEAGVTAAVIGEVRAGSGRITLR